jgi:hypothetical protein
MNLKKAMYDRIERDCIKVNVNGNTVYMKTKGSIRIIYPPVDIKSVEENTDSMGNIDWKKVKWDKVALIFGSKQNAIMTAIVGIITLLLAWGAHQLISSFNTIISNPIVQGCLENAGLIVSVI